MPKMVSLKRNHQNLIDSFTNWTMYWYVVNARNGIGAEYIVAKVWIDEPAWEGEFDTAFAFYVKFVSRWVNCSVGFWKWNPKAV